MRRFRTSKARGFTLVELMIVVAIIGVLAALAIYGVRKYLASAKSAEAKNGIGGITRAAVAAFERESAPSEIVAPGQQSTTASNQLCQSAGNPVPPGTPPAGKKYTPNNTPGTDFSAGTATAGWLCLKYTMEEPIRYQYRYLMGAGYISPGLGGPTPNGANGQAFEASAQGDLDGNSVFSTFAQTGQVEQTTGQLNVSTVLFENQAEE